MNQKIDRVTEYKALKERGDAGFETRAMGVSCTGNACWVTICLFSFQLCILTKEEILYSVRKGVLQCHTPWLGIVQTRDGFNDV